VLIEATDAEQILRVSRFISALTFTPVLLLLVYIGMPAAHPAMAPFTMRVPEIGEHGEPLTALSPPEPAGGAPGPYQYRLSGPKSMKCGSTFS
jgi:hypothetical protein